MMAELLRAACRGVETIGVRKMPAKEKEQSKKVIELQSMADRRRRKRNAEVSEIAAQKGDTCDDESTRDEKPAGKSFEERTADLRANNVWPRPGRLSNLELISEVMRRFALPNDKKRLGYLLKHAAFVAAPQLKTLALERCRWQRIVGALREKRNSADLARLVRDRDELVRCKVLDAVLRRGVDAGIRRANRNLCRIPSHDLLEELLRFACPKNDLGEVLEIISRGVDKPKIVKTARRARSQ
jgi:hypothetical protein